MTVKNISQEELKSRYFYNSETGEFIHLSGKFAGKAAGYIHTYGYRHIFFNKSNFLAHRLAWVYVHGHISDGHVIDHINGKRDDNRLVNLRAVTPKQNAGNIGVKHTPSRLQKNITLGKIPNF